MSVFCKDCKKTKDNEDFGINYNGSQYKTCVMCRDYDKKRNKLATKNDEAARRGLHYCNECEKAKPKDKFVMPNGNSYDQCRSCLIYGSDEDDSSSSRSSYNSDQCGWIADDYEVGFSNMYKYQF